MTKLYQCIGSHLKDGSSVKLPIICDAITGSNNSRPGCQCHQPHPLNKVGNYMCILEGNSPEGSCVCMEVLSD